MTTVYVVCSGQCGSYGVYLTEEEAKQKIRELYKNGYCGELEVSEDEISLELGVNK